MPIVVPTRTPASLGSVKSDAVAATDEATELLASQYNVSADKLIEVINLANANESAAAANAGNISSLDSRVTTLEGGSSGLLFEWNGVDVSQFLTPFMVSTNAGGTSGMNLGVVTGELSASGNRIELEGTGSGTSGEHYVVALLDVSLPPAYRVEINSDFCSVNDINRGVAYCMFGDVTDGPGNELGYLFHPNSRRGRADSGVVDGGTGATVTSYNGSAQHEIRVEGRIGADYPRGQVLFTQRAGDGQENRSTVLRNAFDANDGNWAIGSLPPAAWNGKACDRFGLALLTTGNLTPPNWYINSLRIFAL